MNPSSSSSSSMESCAMAITLPPPTLPESLENLPLAKSLPLSCHQCRKRCAISSQILWCQFKGEKKAKQRRIRACHKKYCYACICKHYQQQPTSFTSKWVCFACQGKCTCSKCKRKPRLARFTIPPPLSPKFKHKSKTPLHLSPPLSPISPLSPPSEPVSPTSSSSSPSPSSVLPSQLLSLLRNIPPSMLQGGSPISIIIPLHYYQSLMKNSSSSEMNNLHSTPLFSKKSTEEVQTFESGLPLFKKQKKILSRLSAHRCEEE